VYLDIETDGAAGNAVTIIGLYDGKNYRCLIQGEDLENFRDVISHYSMVVTFFGFSYDIPVLQKQFPGVDFDQIHVDLCPMLGHLNLRGGLKKIEKEIGIERSPETQGLTGRDAVFLWRKHRTRDDANALERLIAYNKEDCVNLERLAEYAYQGLKARAMEEAGLDSTTGMKTPIGIGPIMPISHVPQLPGLEELVEV
jgi:uncharacterized protein